MADITNEGTAKEFADLPPEIVSNILALLPYQDLKSSRLVSRQWYEASLAFNILDEEVLVYPYYDEFKETFQKSKRDFLHIKVFEGDQNIWCNDWFWSKIKPKVRSLWFEESDISEYHVFSLLDYCPMLKSLRFKLCDFSGEDLSEEKISGLDSLKLSRLKTLSLTYAPPYYNVDILHKIVGCAPNLELLSLSETLSPGETTSLSLAQHAVTFCERNPHRNLSISLNFKLQISDHAMFKLVSSPLVELEGLILNWVIEDWNPGLFKNCSTLQRLDVTTCVNDDALSVVCNELRGLAHLSLHDCSKVVNGVEKLASLTKLKSLSMYKCSKVSGESIITGLCSKVDKTLRTLAICGLRKVPVECYVELAKCHPAVTNIELLKSNISNDGVTAITVYQPLVTHLRLGGCRNISDEVLPSLALLKDLKLLELQRTKVEGVPFEGGLTMPVLQSICLNHTMVSEKSVRCLIENHKALRDLWVWGCQFDMVNLEDLLSTRPHLRCHPE